VQLHGYVAPPFRLFTQSGVAADRFAREIVGILKGFPGALAAAERQAVGRVRCSAFTSTSHAEAADDALARLGHGHVADNDMLGRLVC
jgi:hypothetical protein